MNQGLLYPIADMVHMTLHQMPDDRFRAAGTRTLQVAGINMDSETIVVSDVFEEKEAGYFIKVHRNLWMYTAVKMTKNAAQGAKQVALVFDSEKVGITIKDAPAFGGVSIFATMEKLLPFVTAVMKFKQPHWEQVSRDGLKIDDLERALQE